MKRKSLGFLALSVSVLLVLQTPITAMAAAEVNNNNESVDMSGSNEYSGDVTVSGSDKSVVSADESGDSLTINGNVTSSNEERNADYEYPATVSASNGAHITIEGNVSADENTAVDATGINSAVAVNGSVTNGSNSMNNTISINKGASVTVNGNVEHPSDALGHAIGILHGGSVTVTGDVISNCSGCPTIYISSSPSDPDSSVKVEGNVTSNFGGVYNYMLSNNNSDIYIGKDVTSKDTAVDMRGNNSKIDIKGNVTSSGDTLNGTVYAYDSTVNIDGNVTHLYAPDSKKDSAINAKQFSNINVGGNVSGGTTSINAENNSNVTVNGNVSAQNKCDGNAIYLNLKSTDEDALGKIVVLGDVNASGDANAIFIKASSKSNHSFDEEYNDFISMLPEIVVGKLNAQNGNFVYNSLDATIEKNIVIAEANGNDDAKASYEANLNKTNEAIYSKIKYFINIDSADTNGTVDVQGAELSSDGYLVAGEKGKLSITARPNEGYELSSISGGDNIDIQKNDDGTYTVVVPRGGGIKISALFKAIEQTIPSTPDTPSEIPPASSTDTSSSESGNLPVPGSTDYINEIIMKIKNTPQNGVFDIDMKDLICLNWKVFEVLAERPDITVNITCTYDKHKYLITIPYGHFVINLFNENGYCGCLYLNSLFG